MKTFYLTKYRRFDSDIWVFEFKPSDVVFEVVQMANRTPLTKIFSGWWKNLLYTKVAGVNGSFFPFTKESVPLGLNYLYEGLLVSDSKPDDEFMEMVYNGDKLFFADVTFANLKSISDKIKWAISIGNLLVDEGKKKLTKSEKFDHAKYPNPRTMVGQKKDGTIILSVVEGRSSEDRGLTADQQADFLIEIGAWRAGNCDGGGSSTMTVEGKVINELSGGVERAVANGLLVYVKGAYQIIKTDYSVPQATTGTIRVISTVKLSKNFTLQEAACRHCGDVKIEDYRLIESAQAVRDYFDKAVRIVLYRCPEHNKAIGGNPNSAHMYGLGIDISAWYKDVSPEDIKKYLIAKFPDIEGIGLYTDGKGNGHVHIDFAHGGKRVEWFTYTE